MHGVDAEYWKITEMKFDWWNNVAFCRLSGFVNAQARADIKEPIRNDTFRYEGDAFDFNIDSQLVEALYLKIKAHEDWSAALDV